MCRPKRISSATAVIVALMFALSALCHAQGGPVRKGKLVLTDLPSSDIPVLDRPPCKSPPLCNAQITDLANSLKIKTLSEIGIMVNPVDGDLDLGGFALEIHSNRKLVFATQPVNGMLKATGTGTPNNPGYLFMLDRNAIQAGSKFFVPGNTIGFTAKTSGKGDGSVTYKLVKAGGSKGR
jgi:hypothetical protein